MSTTDELQHETSDRIAVEDDDIVENLDLAEQFIEVDLEDTRPRVMIPWADISWDEIVAENFAGNIALSYEHDAAEEAAAAASASAAPDDDDLRREPPGEEI